MESSLSHGERISAEDLSAKDRTGERVLAPVGRGSAQSEGVSSPVEWECTPTEGVSSATGNRTRGCIAQEETEEIRGLEGARLSSTESGTDKTDAGGAEGAVGPADS